MKHLIILLVCCSLSQLTFAQYGAVNISADPKISQLVDVHKAVNARTTKTKGFRVQIIQDSNRDLVRSKKIELLGLYPNTENNDPDLFQFKSTTPYILNTLKTSRRFVKQVNPDSTTTIQFGSGDPTVSEETIIPSFKNVGLGLPNSISKLEESFDPTNFLKTKTYGTSPSNTTMTVKYLVGGGVESNVKKGTITQINGVEYEEDIDLFTNVQLGLYRAAKNSIAIDNEVPATGGKGGDTIEEIRENALANFGSQNRAVTAKDYQVRVLSMPTKYGSIAKSYATADGTLDNNSPSSILSDIPATALIFPYCFTRLLRISILNVQSLSVTIFRNAYT